MKCIELPLNWLPVNQLIDQLTLHWVLFTATHWFQREHQDTVEYNFSGLDLERDVFIWFYFSHVSSGIRFVYWLQTHFLQPTAVLKNQYDYWCRCVEFETVSASCWLTPSHYSLCSTFFTVMEHFDRCCCCSVFLQQLQLSLSLAQSQSVNHAVWIIFAPRNFERRILCALHNSMTDASWR